MLMPNLKPIVPFLRSEECLPQTFRTQTDGYAEVDLVLYAVQEHI